MATKQYFLMLINKAQNLKDTQIFGKQSPRVHLSVGKSIQEQATSSIKENAGCYCVWNETIYVELKTEVQFLLVEVKSGSNLIGLARIAASKVSEFHYEQDLHLTDQSGKPAGKLSCSVQRFLGDLNQLHALAFAMKSGGGGMPASVMPAADKFLSSIHRAPVSQTAGGFQQPVTHAGGFQQPAAHTRIQQHHQQQHGNIIPGGFQQVNVSSQTLRQPQYAVRPPAVPHTRPPAPFVDTSGRCEAWLCM